MLDEMSPEVLLRWQYFRQKEPFWWEQIRDMLAQVCSLIANTTEDGEGKHYIYRGERGAAKQPADFMPKSWFTQYEVKPEQIQAKTASGHNRGMSAHDASSFLSEIMK